MMLERKSHTKGFVRQRGKKFIGNFKRYMLLLFLFKNYLQRLVFL